MANTNPTLDQLIAMFLPAEEEPTPNPSSRGPFSGPLPSNFTMFPMSPIQVMAGTRLPPQARQSQPVAVVPTHPSDDSDFVRFLHNYNLSAPGVPSIHSYHTGTAPSAASDQLPPQDLPQQQPAPHLQQRQTPVYIPSDLNRTNLSAYFPVWGGIYDDIRDTATSMMCTRRIARIWTHHEKIFSKNTNAQLAAHPLNFLAIETIRIMISQLPFPVEAPAVCTQTGVSLMQLISYWITQEMIEHRDELVSITTAVVFNFGFRNPDAKSKPYVAPDKTQASNQMYYNQANVNDAFVHIWGEIGLSRPTIGPYMNPNVINPIQHHFYVGSGAIAARMVAVGRKFPAMRNDPRYQYLFSWEWELPLVAYMLVATTVKYSLRAWHTGIYTPYKWGSSLSNFYTRHHQYLTNNAYFDRLRQELGRRFFNASHLGDQRGAVTDSSDF